MIRQAISCDICGTEKKQSNHWFAAQEHSGELRVSGWNSRIRSRPGSKHLCGQTCLHKLVDDFMARLISARSAPIAVEAGEAAARPSATDASLTSASAHGKAEPARRPKAPVAPGRSSGLPAQEPQTPGPVAVPAPMPLEAAAGSAASGTPTYRSPGWRADAWEREREREQRTAGRQAELAARGR